MAARALVASILPSPCIAFIRWPTSPLTTTFSFAPPDVLQLSVPLSTAPSVITQLPGLIASEATLACHIRSIIVSKYCRLSPPLLATVTFDSWPMLILCRISNSFPVAKSRPWQVLPSSYRQSAFCAGTLTVFHFRNHLRSAATGIFKTVALSLLTRHPSHPFLH